MIKSTRLKFLWHIEGMGESKGKRPLGRPKRRRKDAIKKNLREIGQEYIRKKCKLNFHWEARRKETTQKT
jgi:hypothetical protein